MKRYIIIALISVLTIIMSSCQHKELCYDHPHSGTLNVVIDWSKAPLATPATMELLLFPKNGGPALYHQFANRNGGSLKVPSGVYRAICLNPGEGANRYSSLNTSFEDFRVLTRPVSDEEALVQMRSLLSANVPNATNHDDESTILEPDTLYSSHLDDEILVVANCNRTVIFYPERRTPHYTVILKNVRNLKYTKGRMASVSDLSCGYMVGLDRPIDSGHTQFFTLGMVDETTLQGTLTVFGHRHDQEAHHFLSIYFTLLDGRGICYNFDITRQICTPELEGEMDVTIVIDMGVEIPKPIVNGSGFHPTVDDWKNENIEISM